MTITKELILNCLKYEIDMNQFSVLYAILQNWDIKTNPAIGAYVKQLETKGLILNGNLTELGKTILGQVTSNSTDSVEEIYNDVKQHMVKVTGKPNLKGFGNVYFMTTLVELRQFLARFWKMYPDFKDPKIIAGVIKDHISDCKKKGNYSPAIKYFIIKEAQKGVYSSQLANAYENYSFRNTPEKTQASTFFEI